MHWLNVQTSIHLGLHVYREKKRNDEMVNQSRKTILLKPKHFWSETFEKQRQENQIRKKTLMAKHISMHMIFPPTTKSASLIYRKNFFETSILTSSSCGSVNWLAVCMHDAFLAFIEIKAKQPKNGNKLSFNIYTYLQKMWIFLNGRFNFDCIPQWIHLFRMKELSLEFLKSLCCHFLWFDRYSHKKK